VLKEKKKHFSKTQHVVTVSCHSKIVCTPNPFQAGNAGWIDLIRPLLLCKNIFPYTVPTSE